MYALRGRRGDKQAGTENGEPPYESHDEAVVHYVILYFVVVLFLVVTTTTKKKKKESCDGILFSHTNFFVCENPNREKEFLHDESHDL
jgi:hypothetical protein